MLPPMNAYSIAATTVSMPLIRPVAVMTASFRPVAAMLASRRLRYGLVSVNFSGSVDVQPVVEFLPLAVEQRPQPFGGAQPEVMAHFVQTLRLAARSLL